MLKQTNPCAKPLGIKKEKSSFSEITRETCFPKFLDFFLRSTATSNILPWATVIIFDWDDLVWICNPLKTFFLEKDIKSNSKVNKTELSKIVAEKLAKKANEKKITKIYFDRGNYKYHGRIKIFAETLRKNGMEF